MSLSSEYVSKKLDKNILKEGQFPVLAKEDVDMIKKLSSSSEQNYTLKSDIRVRSAEITRKEHRDLGVTFVFISGHHKDQTGSKPKVNIKFKEITKEPTSDPAHASSIDDDCDIWK